MAAKYTEASQEVVDLVTELIGQHASLAPLAEMDIALSFRDKAPLVNGMYTYGQARKISPEMRMLMEPAYDFLIWFAEDTWYTLSPHQKRALVHHELLHCGVKEDGETAYMIPHDVQEFNEILSIYGFWWPSSDATEIAAQMALELPMTARKQGRVEAYAMPTMAEAA